MLLPQSLRAKSAGPQRRRGNSGRGGRSVREHSGADAVTLMCPMLLSKAPVLDSLIQHHSVHPRREQNSDLR